MRERERERERERKKKKREIMSKKYFREKVTLSGGERATMTVLWIQTAQLLLWGRSTHWQKLGNK